MLLSHTALSLSKYNIPLWYTTLSSTLMVNWHISDDLKMAALRLQTCKCDFIREILCIVKFSCKTSNHAQCRYCLTGSVVKAEVIKCGCPWKSLHTDVSSIPFSLLTTNQCYFSMNISNISKPIIFSLLQPSIESYDRLVSVSNRFKKWHLNGIQ